MTKIYFTLIALLWLGTSTLTAHAYGCGGPCNQGYGAHTYYDSYYAPQYNFGAYQPTSYDYTGPAYAYNRPYNTGYGYNTANNAYNRMYDYGYYPQQQFYGQPWIGQQQSVWGALAYGATSALFQNTNAFYDPYFDDGFYYGY